MRKAALLLLCLVCLASALRAQETVVGGCTYRLAPAGDAAVVKGAAEGEPVIMPVVVIDGQERRVTSIATGAFRGSGISAITLPPTLEAIDHEAFYGCENLKKVALPAGVTEILGTSFAACASLEEFAVAAGNFSYAAVGGVLFNYDRTRLVSIPGGRRGTYAVPDAVSVIEGGALCCPRLDRLVLPASVVSIEGEPLERVLDKMPWLSGIAIAPDSRLPYCTDEGMLLKKTADGTVLVRCPRGAEDEVTVSPRATAIAAQAFAGCKNVSNICILDGLAAISADAFADADALTDIHCLSLTPPAVKPEGDRQAPVMQRRLTVHVMKQAKKAFKKAPFWKDQKIVTLRKE